MNVQSELAGLRDLARQADSYAYRFYGPGMMDPDELLKGTEGADRIELRVWPDGAFRVTACDITGRPLAGPVPPANSDNVAYQIGGGQGVFQPGVKSQIVQERWQAEERLAEVVEELRDEEAPVADIVIPAKTVSLLRRWFGT